MNSPSKNTWQNGRRLNVRQTRSPNFSPREPNEDVSLVVLHNISLPSFEYNIGTVEKLFANQINPDEHPFFSIIHALYVSSHFFINRKGETVQFISCDDMAYHVGVSSFQGRKKYNAFSIGIELEGCDFEPFTEARYTSPQALLTVISEHYPTQAVTGHRGIAPDRKTDPEHFFDWHRFQKAGFPVRHGQLSDGPNTG